MRLADEINQDRLLETFLSLARIDSPSGQERKISQELFDQLQNLGCIVHQDNAGNLIAEYPGQGTEALLLACHMDTTATDADVNPVVRDGVVYSDGTTILGADDKAGIAILLESLQVLNEQPDEPHPPLEIVITVGKETDSYGCHQMDLSQLRSTWGLVLDTGGPIGTLIESAPSSRNFTITISGQAARAGVDPEQGINAINVASKAICTIAGGGYDEETIFNLGTIRGGTTRTLVPDKVIIEAMARSHNQEKLEAQTSTIINAFNEAATHYNAWVEVQIEDIYYSYTVAPEQKPYREYARAVASLGFDLHPRKSGDGNDGNLFNHAGIQCIPISTGMANEHKKDEYIVVEDMFNAARVVITVITQESAIASERFADGLTAKEI